MKLKKLISIVLLAICILSFTACGSNEITPTIEPFPKFEATDFNGNTVTNEIFKGYDVTIVNFWTNGCGSCIAEMPELEEYYQKFKKEKHGYLLHIKALLKGQCIPTRCLRITLRHKKVLI